MPDALLGRAPRSISDRCQHLCIAAKDAEFARSGVESVQPGAFEFGCVTPYRI